ncbi:MULTISPECIES: polymorphic toxin type 44 domain-containing protein [Pseudomonas]|uniref:Bacteriocin n=1 Tax=Pseudomonas azadiae TaxID=2843612 RepID=A0ABS6NY95_9PSED|nr:MULTISPECIES: polymorphic toxin type 44 domain-containing protein [Pseudomonas]MBV4453192.1 bacteriocin [Pseudomonas azadiae]
MAVPLMPPSVSILENMAISKSKRIHLKAGSSFAYSWFYSQVRAAGPWNYKKQGRQYEAFGNFNYGATGTVLGIPESVLLRAAGVAQTFAKTTMPEFGAWWGGDPFGDDPRDQYWIRRGIEYAISQGH